MTSGTSDACEFLSSVVLSLHQFNYLIAQILNSFAEADVSIFIRLKKDRLYNERYVDMPFFISKL